MARVSSARQTLADPRLIEIFIKQLKHIKVPDMVEASAGRLSHFSTSMEFSMRFLGRLGMGDERYTDAHTHTHTHTHACMQ